MITQERLKELLHYDPNTGIFTRLVSRYNIKKGDIAGSLSPSGYVYLCADSKRYAAHRLAWFYVYGYWPENDIDHINRIKNDNRICNLRHVSHMCNIRNSKLSKNNTSGVNGVHWDKSRKKFTAQIKINRKKVTLGRSSCILEAACHRLCAEQFEDWNQCDKGSSAQQFVRKYI